MNAQRQSQLVIRGVRCAVGPNETRYATVAADATLERLPRAVLRGLKLLSIDGFIRCLRALVKASLQKADEVLGTDEMRLGCRKLLIPAGAVAEHVN